MKKLLIDANAIVPFYVNGKLNGIGRTTLELLQALAAIKEEIPFEIALYSQNMKGIGGRSAQLPFKSRHLYWPHRPKFDQWVSKLHLRECLYDYDLLHVPTNYEQVARPDKCLVTLHDALFMHIQEKAFGHDKMKQVVPGFIRSCKHVVTCSEYSKQDIVNTMQVYPDKIDVIYWGVKHDTFYFMPDKEVVRQQLEAKFQLHFPYFLSVSCNAERKRTDKLVEAYLKHYREGARHHLVLLWGNPPQSLLDMLKQHPGGQSVHFLSNVTDEDLALLYNGAAAAFTPSSFEGFGLPLIEAMACGTPVITARNSSLPEVGSDVAYYLEEPLVDSIVRYMDDIENGFDATLDRIHRGLDWAATFTWEKCARQMVALYDRLLNQ